MFIIAPIGTYDVTIDVALTNVSATIMADNDLITNNKVEIPNCIKQQGGASQLIEFWFLQKDNSASADLETAGFELYIFDNPDSLGALVSNNPFAFDANTGITNVVYHKTFVTGDWITTADGNNCYAHAIDLNTVCKTSEAGSYSLYFVLVTTGTPTFDDHTLTCRFVFRQIKTKD